MDPERRPPGPAALSDPLAATLLYGALDSGVRGHWTRRVMRKYRWLCDQSLLREELGWYGSWVVENGYLGPVLARLVREGISATAT